MNAMEVFEMTRRALAITGLPVFPSPDEPEAAEALMCLDADGGGPEWALVPCEDPMSASCGPELVEYDGDYAPLDASLAVALIKARLSDWLLERGWQVQVSMRKGTRTWRLVDCLSFSDGGGDRLDQDYPFGGQELHVLVESVLLLAAR